MRFDIRASLTARSTALTLCAALAFITFHAGDVQAELMVVENADNQQGLTVFKMTVTPAPEPTPALKYRLMPKVLEMRPGNAAMYYTRAFAEHGVAGRWKDILNAHGEEEVSGGGGKAAWYSSARPFDTMPMDKAREAAAAFDVIVEQCVARGTVRENCDWGRNIEELEGLDIIALLLPEIQETRELSRMLMLRTRMAIADGDYDKAIDHLRMNYRLGQNVASDPILICGLVGIAEVGLGNYELPELIAAKNSPNLYWALAELPRPFIDLYPATRYELSWGMKIFPVLIDPEKQEHSPEEWARLLANSLRDMQAAAAGDTPMNEFGARLGVVGLGLLAYPDAKRRLLASGMDAAEIERMPAGQVIAVDASREYQRIAQEFEKWWYTPYTVAKKRTSDPDVILHNRFKSGYGGILASLLMPALQRVRDAQMRLDWQLNALQAIEAIRMHAALAGKLPQSLQEITIVPVPKNPVTEKDYAYRLNGDTAILELPSSDGFTGVAWRYEIKLAK